MRRLAERLLPRAALATLALLYLVVLAGAVVRATGSGMGCPDWPRCYGRLIPPTRAEEIDFSKLDLAKYQRSWATHGRAAVPVTEESVRKNFNAAETWTEFINRCLGAISGLAALGTLACAVVARPRDGKLLGLLAGQLVLFGVVAWLGKVVVDTNLLPWKITLHMMLAMGLVTTALLARHRVAPRAAVPVSGSLRIHLWVCAVAVVVQTFAGTQVRELVDREALAACCGDRLEQKLGGLLAWHRVGAIAVLTLVAVAFFRLKATSDALGAAPVAVRVLGLLVALEYGVGVILVKAGLPALLQPVHLVLAFILHGLLLALLLRCRLRRVESTASLREVSVS